MITSVSWRQVAGLTLMAGMLGLSTWVIGRSKPSPADRIGAFHRVPADRPVLDAGRAGVPLIVMDPNVLTDAEGYHLFFTSYFYRRQGRWRHAWDPGAHPPSDLKETMTAIGYAYSADKGQSWVLRETPVLSPQTGAWDGNRVETASVVKHGDRLLMFYCADGLTKGRLLTSRYQIGVSECSLHGRSIRTAMSDPAQTFKRIGSGKPLLAFETAAPSFLNNIQEPSAIVSGNRVELFFVGLNLAQPDAPVDQPGQRIQQVGLGRAVLDGQLRLQTISRQPYLTGGNIVEVRKLGDTYHLFATTTGNGPVHGGERLERYTSPDGEHWSKPVPILDGVPAAHDDWAMMSPTVAVEPAALVLFYTALGVQPGDCFPVPADGRWGIPLPDHRCLHGTLGRAVAPLRP